MPSPTTRPLSATGATPECHVAAAATAVSVSSRAAESMIAVAASVLTIRDPIGPLRPADGYDLVTPGQYVAAVSSPEPPAISDLPVDYVSDSELVLRNGKSLRLLATQITKVQRVPEGFVVVERQAYEKQRAWYVQERTGDQTVLLDGATGMTS